MKQAGVNVHFHTIREAGNMSWKQVRRIEGVEDDDRLARNQFKGPPALFDHLDRNHDGFLSKADFTAVASTMAATAATAPTGLLYFASYRERRKPPARAPVLIS